MICTYTEIQMAYRSLSRQTCFSEWYRNILGVQDVRYIPPIAAVSNKSKSMLLFYKTGRRLDRPGNQNSTTKLGSNVRTIQLRALADKLQRKVRQGSQASKKTDSMIEVNDAAHVLRLLAATWLVQLQRTATDKGSGKHLQRNIKTDVSKCKLECSKAVLF